MCGPVLCSGDHIAVPFGDGVGVLDPEGKVVSRWPWRHERAVLVACSGGLLVARHAGGLVAVEPTGRERWRRDEAGSRIVSHMTPAGDLLLWTHNREHGSTTREAFQSIDSVSGDVLWRSTQSRKLPGYILGTTLACDDAGSVYALGWSRLGDGVSGDDLTVGALLALTPTGEHAWSVPLRGGYVKGLVGLRDGVLLLGSPGRRYPAAGPAGLVELGVDLDRETGTQCADLRLVFHAQFPRVAEVLHHSLVRRCAVDGSGRSFFVLHERPRSRSLLDRILRRCEAPTSVVALAPDRSLLWRVPLAGNAVSWGAPVIGPENTTLVVHDGHLLALR